MFYTTILHSVRIELGLSCNDYCVADMIYRLAANPAAPVNGWCNASRKYMAEKMGLSRQSIISIIQSLVSKGLVEENEDHNCRTTSKWYDAIEGCKESLQGVKKLDKGCKESLQQPVKKLDTDNKNDNEKENIIIIIQGETNENSEVLGENGQSPPDPNPPVAPAPLPQDEPEPESIVAVLMQHQKTLRNDPEWPHWCAKSLSLTDEQFMKFFDRFFAKQIADKTERCRIYGNCKDYCYNWIQKRLESEGNPNERTNQNGTTIAPKTGGQPASTGKRTAFIQPGALRRPGT